MPCRRRGYGDVTATYGSTYPQATLNSAGVIRGQGASSSTSPRWRRISGWQFVPNASASCRKGSLADVALPAAAMVEPAQQPAAPTTRPQERAPEPRPPAQPSHLSATQPAPAVDSGPDDTHRIVRDSRWDDLAHNTPGESARTRAKELRAQHPFLVTSAKALGIRTTAGSFAMGATGEREVGRKLNRWAAQNGWHVLHAVPVGRGGCRHRPCHHCVVRCGDGQHQGHEDQRVGWRVWRDRGREERGLPAQVARRGPPGRGNSSAGPPGSRCRSKRSSCSPARTGSRYDVAAHQT